VLRNMSKLRDIYMSNLRNMNELSSMSVLGDMSVLRDVSVLRNISVYRSGLLDRKKTGKRPDQTGNLTRPQLRSFRLKMKNRKKTG
jgi:hypothetical protein